MDVRDLIEQALAAFRQSGVSETVVHAGMSLRVRLSEDGLREVAVWGEVPEGLSVPFACSQEVRGKFLVFSELAVEPLPGPGVPSSPALGFRPGLLCPEDLRQVQMHQLYFVELDERIVTFSRNEKGVFSWRLLGSESFGSYQMGGLSDLQSYLQKKSRAGNT